MRKLHTILFALSAFLGALPLIGCDLGTLTLDEANPEKVANYYYSPGRKKTISWEKKYAFLSEKSKAQVSKDEWVKKNSGYDNNYYASVKLQGEKEVSGRKYAIVSVTEQIPQKDGKIYKRVSATTWVLESGRWRRLIFPKTQEELRNTMKAGDYAAAKAKADEWLSIDPFAVEAYKTLGFAISRTGDHIFIRGDRSLRDILRALLAIDPEDTTVLFCAATWSETPSIAKTYLKKLEGTISYSSAAFNVAINIRDPKALLKFFEGMEITPALAILKLDALAKLSSWDVFRKVAESEGRFDNIQAALDGDDAAFAASWAGDLGLMFHNAKDDDTARKWLEYGITRDPNGTTVKALARRLDRPSK